MSIELEQVAENKCCGGRQLQYTHVSQVLGCSMRFSIFLPSVASTQKVPVLYWLSGLTCTDENFVQKAGAQRYAEQYKVAIVAPDTSPRGEHIPDDKDKAYDFGLGAGFYVNATEPPWNTNYRMYDYIVDELPKLISEHFPVDHSACAIFGHSMGGHGALTIGLRNTDKYASISAFAPISSPLQCPWGQKALGNYLGDNQETWKKHDASELLMVAEQQVPILIDQGTDDVFLTEQLKPELIQAAAAKTGYPLTLRVQEGYDHSYFFMASFIEEHIRFHAEHLQQAG